MRDRLLWCQEHLGFGNLMAMLQVASMPADMTEANIRLFASQVMPALQAERPSRAMASVAAA